MATAVDSGRGAVSDMTSMESWASDTVGELVAALAQRQSQRRRMQCSRHGIVSAVDESGDRDDRH